MAATVTRQLIEHRHPTGPAEEAQVRQEAVQVAAEMIQAQRADLSDDRAEDEELEESAYLRFRQELVERERTLQAWEAEQADRLE